MVKKALYQFLIPTCLAGAFIIGLSLIFIWLLRPTIAEKPEPYDKEEAARLAEERKVQFDIDDPLRIQTEVDYSEGPSASWYPKGESPILRELVNEGKLPPVAERTGPEPLVLSGVESIGQYGGTWNRINFSNTDVGAQHRYLSAGLLTRWSPFGYPIVPHVAKSWEHSEDYKEWTYHLRKGLRWSDGHPFTAEDIVYWWEWDIKYFEGKYSTSASSSQPGGGFPDFMRIEGRAGEIVMVDPHTVKYVFPLSNPFFLEQFAASSTYTTNISPRHYMESFHPQLGDKELIKETMARLHISSPESLYRNRQQTFNPEHPRLWAWVYKTHRPSAPHVFVRNPYFFAVDREGNQLPYIDRIFYEVKPIELFPTTFASGSIHMHTRLTNFADSTEYMTNRKANGYEVYHWYQGGSSYWAIWPNLNKRIDPDDRTTEQKWRLLNDKRFRQALSLAIDREPIIEAVMLGYPQPAQMAPGAASPFHHEKLLKSFTQHDPDRANDLLDSIGLENRDYEGYRTFPDGTRMVWYLHHNEILMDDPVHFVIDDWRKVGLRTISKERSNSLWIIETHAMTNDFTVWQGHERLLPLISPSDWIPVRASGFYSAIGFAKWYNWGGLHGDPLATQLGGIEPPIDHPLRRSMEILAEARRATTRDERREILNEVFDMAAEEVWTISLFEPPPQPVIVKNGFRNVPKIAVYGVYFSVPANAGIETYFIENANERPATIAKLKKEITVTTPDPRLIGATVAQNGNDPGHSMAKFLQWLIVGILLLGMALVAFHHPFIGRRLLILIPTLLIISVVAFITIQLPPGNFIESKLLQLQASGMQANEAEFRQLKSEFHLDKPVLFQYSHWMGLNWFLTFDSKDRGLLQGNLGRSMEYRTSVNSIVGDRILLTVVVALFTIVFTWGLALPIGIYSAVRQYSWSDYLFTFLAFVGMSVPGFLFALILMYLGGKYFGVPILGLFSPEFASQADWDWAKFKDMLKHIWIPIIVIGAAGVAQLMRVMRGNLLDELNKPYVVTARAKGVRPFKLLMKYPVRVALNPFISSIGIFFPQLISGGAIVAIVLSLPMVGPMILEAFLSEDVYLAGSLLMVLSLLGVFGTLVSDLLLLWLDPRIRMESGSR